MIKLLTLAALGAAAYYFLNSEQGRKLTNQVRDRVKDKMNDIEDAVNQKLVAATEKIEKTAGRIDQSLPGTH
jgi:hypothetical protein